MTQVENMISLKWGSEPNVFKLVWSLGQLNLH